MLFRCFPAAAVCGNPRFWRRTAVAVWAILLLASFVWVGVYKSTPGAQASPPPLHQVDLPTKFDSGRHVLLMAVHPKCPCTEASIGELGRLLVWHQSEVQCALLVFRPEHSQSSWSGTSTVESAVRLTGARFIDDPGGRYAEQLGMLTSGAVVLYSPEGVVEFHGGITLDRGHWGDNVGSNTIHAILGGQTSANCSTPVYGCEILPFGNAKERDVLANRAQQ